MVNRERVQMLVDALRSGDWEQGIQQLVVIDTLSGRKQYCCLGVAMEVAIANGCPITFEDRGDTRYYTDPNGQGAHVVLSPAAADWYGFNSDNPNLKVRSGDLQEPEGYEAEFPDAIVQEAATELNDDKHWNFHQIADAFQHTFLEDTNGES